MLQDLFWYQEEPIADLSGLGMLALSQLAASHVTVALSGQGADELLGGYRKHQIAAMAGAVRRVPGLRRRSAGIGGAMPGGSSLARGPGGR